MSCKIYFPGALTLHNTDGGQKDKCGDDCQTILEWLDETLNFQHNFDTVGKFHFIWENQTLFLSNGNKTRLQEEDEDNLASHVRPTLYAYFLQ